MQLTPTIDRINRQRQARLAYRVIDGRGVPTTTRPPKFWEPIWFFCTILLGGAAIGLGLIFLVAVLAMIGGGR